MYTYICKKILKITVLSLVFAIMISNSVFAETNADISQILKEFEVEDNPIDNSIINSNTNIFTDEMNTLDNSLLTIFSEPAVSDNYDKICPLFYKSNISGIKMFVDGQLIEFSKYDNVNPVIIDGRVFVPIRALAESLGATVNWNAADKKAEIQLFDKTIEIVLNSKTAMVNGKETPLDASAKLIDGRTLLPVRFISESFSKTVEWHSYNKTLNVLAIY